MDSLSCTKDDNALINKNKWVEALEENSDHLYVEIGIDEHNKHVDLNVYDVRLLTENQISDDLFDNKKCKYTRHIFGMLRITPLGDYRHRISVGNYTIAEMFRHCTTMSTNFPSHNTGVEIYDFLALIRAKLNLAV